MGRKTIVFTFKASAENEVFCRQKKYDLLLVINFLFQGSSGPSLTPKQQELFRGSLLAAAEDLIKNEALLNKLDSGCGDGDCGITLKNFALGKFC